MRYDVPIYDNPNGMNCLQSVFKMTLKYFEPDQDFSWEFLEKVTDKKPSMATWPMAGVLWLKKRGYDVYYIEKFDYADFAQRGATFLIDTFGQKAASWMITHSDLAAEQKRARIFAKLVPVEQRHPTIDDIKAALHNGYLVKATVNSSRLNGKPGFVGHFVLVVGYDDHGFYVNDPGGPQSIKNRHVPWQLFTAAWADPNDDAKSLLAIKLTKN